MLKHNMNSICFMHVCYSIVADNDVENVAFVFLFF